MRDGRRLARQPRASPAGVILEIRDWLAAKAWRNEWEDSPTQMQALLSSGRNALAGIARLNLDLARLHLLGDGNLDVQNAVLQPAINLSTFRPLGSVTAA